MFCWYSIQNCIMINSYRQMQRVRANLPLNFHCLEFSIILNFKFVAASLVLFSDFFRNCKDTYKDAAAQSRRGGAPTYLSCYVVENMCKDAANSTYLNTLVHQKNILKIPNSKRLFQLSANIKRNNSLQTDPTWIGYFM